MADETSIGVDARQFCAIALESRRIGTQDKFLDFAMLWATDADRYIDHLTALLEEKGVVCICRGLKLDPFCIVHTLPEIKLLQ
jgi:hypothetical protein